MPVAIDLFCGLGGWTAGLLAEGWTVYGFDIERHVYERHIQHCAAPTETVIDRYPAQLILQDALTINGSQFRKADLIVASPPCQQYSWLAMPWSRSADPENSKAAKALRKKWETEGPDNRLFDACFRIQREAIEETAIDCPGCFGGGHRNGDPPPFCQRCLGRGYVTRYIPMIVENVRGAVPWVGKRDMPLDEWNRLTQAQKIERGRPQAVFGSFYLWGDVGQIGKRVIAGRDLADIQAGRGRFGMGVVPEKASAEKVPGFRFDGSGRSFQSASVAAGAAGQKTLGHVNKRDGHSHTRHLTNQAESDAVRNSPELPDGSKIGGDWFSDPNSTCRKHGSRSNARKAASAMIAKIPPALSQYVGRVHLPQ